MDQARKLDSSPARVPERTRARAESSETLNGIENIVRLSIPSQEPESETPLDRLTGRDFTEAVSLVREASDLMKASDERAKEAEDRMQDLVRRATDELKAAEARIQAADARARLAETRAQEAEDWLARIYATIADEFDPHSKLAQVSVRATGT